MAESEESEVPTEGAGESTRLKTEPAGGVGAGRSPGKEGAASPAPTVVSRTLLLEPVEEKDPPHRVPNLEGEEWARSGSLPNADGFPRVVGPLTRDSGNDKEEVIAGNGLLAWKGGNSDNISTSGPCIRKSDIERLPRCGSIMDGRVVKIAEGGERWCEGGKTEATPPMKAVMKAKAASLETKVSSLRDERPVVSLVGTVDVIEKMIGEGQKVVSSPVENDSESLTYRRWGSKVRSGHRMIRTQHTVRGGAGTTDRVCAVRSIRVREPSVTVTS